MKGRAVLSGIVLATMRWLGWLPLWIFLLLVLVIGVALDEYMVMRERHHREMFNAIRANPEPKEPPPLLPTKTGKDTVREFEHLFGFEDEA